jgi:hypothetical protein
MPTYETLPSFRRKSGVVSDWSCRRGVPKSPFFSGSAHAIGRHRTWQNLRLGAVTHALSAFVHVTGRECTEKRGGTLTFHNGQYAQKIVCSKWKVGPR